MIFTGQGNQVGQLPDRHQVQHFHRELTQQGPGHFKGDPDPGQIGKGILATRVLGVDNRHGRRELFGQGVVVGNDHVNPLLLGILNRRQPGHPVVNGDD